MPWGANANQNHLDEPPPRTNGRSAGSRGCSNDKPILQNTPPALILLTPSQHPVRTVSTNPSFAWFIRDSKPRQVEFRLYKEDSITKKYKLVKEIRNQNFQSKSGIMILPLPNNIFLSKGEKYLWQVELICDRHHPSSNLFAEAEIEVVSIQPKFENKLNDTVNRAEQALLYAKAGFDYDALMAILMMNNSDSIKKVAISKLKLSLLNQVALKPSELKSLQNSSIHLIEINSLQKKW